jgi:glycolate oxidase iron-sulfur subunit
MKKDRKIKEIEEICGNCIKCGICKSLCPVFSIIRTEEISPRGKTSLLNKKILHRVIYECTLCRACEEKCPLKLKLCSAFKEARELLREDGQESESNKEMIKKVREFGNPFGKIEKGKIPDKLYCC